MWLLPKDLSGDYTSITLGIGNDIGVEKQLQKLLPNLKFFGADPIPESGNIFKSIGSYREIAIGSKNGTENGSVLVGGKYIGKQLNTISLVEFLTNTLPRHYVDFLNMDIEGLEYKILPEFYYNGSLEKGGFVFCQINLELHGPLEQYGMNDMKFSKLVKTFLDESKYVPLWVLPPYSHNRMVLLDWQSSECFDKFYSR